MRFCSKSEKTPEHNNEDNIEVSQTLLLWYSPPATSQGMSELVLTCLVKALGYNITFLY